MKNISELQPSLLWKYFEEICQIPRPSKKEEKISEYIVNFGKQHGLETNRDDSGNVMIAKAATKGYEKIPPVVLQSHMDMVGEKNSDSKHDFEKDPIQPYIDGEWVKAKGTTLGADDGIGIAAQLAILADDTVAHGPLECLFTVDEETGLTGAFNLKEGFFKSKILINLDSEDEGELFIGCAGGIDTVAILNYKTRSVPEDSVAFRVSVSGLTGGHSGDDIQKGRGNSIKILNRLLWQANKDHGIRIATFEGGNLRNAIPREANALITVKERLAKDVITLMNILADAIKNEFKIAEPALKITIEAADLPDKVLSGKPAKRLLNVLYACPHGVISMSQAIAGLVETSTNLASVKFLESNQIQITTSQRSSVESARTDIANRVSSVFSLVKATVEHSGGYPGWSPNPDSPLVKLTESLYVKLFGNKPVVRAIHAGLECGLFLEKYPELDMISFGPTILGAHSPDERLNIETAEKFWKLLLEVLKNIK